MMVLFILGLNGIEIAEPFVGQVSIGHGISLTNDSAVVTPLLHKELILSIGNIEANFLLRKGACVVYSVEEVDVSGFDPADYLDVKMTQVRAWANLTWFVKDNSIDCDNGFLEYGDKQMRVYTNTISAQFRTCKGEIVQTVFAIDELNEADKIFDTGYELVYNNDIGSTFARKDFLRLARGFYFLSIARNEHDLGVKIASYCTCFETLFSTSNTELTHRLAERVAFFLNEVPADRLTVYQNIKQAYAVRSSVVHGDLISKKHLGVIESLSEIMDSYIRNVLLMIVKNSDIEKIFETDSEKIDAYFNNLVFGVIKPPNLVLV